MSKLYWISQNELITFYSASDAIVCADNEKDAKECYVGETSYSIQAGGYLVLNTEEVWIDDTDDIEVKYIGEAAEDIPKGLVLAAFNWKPGYRKK
jgi:hypothetical protein